jgi:hypothetical protein
VTSQQGDEQRDNLFPYEPEAPGGVRARSVARQAGVIVACLLLMCGLFMLFAVVAFAVSLGSSGSNK